MPPNKIKAFCLNKVFYAWADTSPCYHAQVLVVRKLGAHNMPDDERATSPAASSGLVISVIAIRKHWRFDLVIANSIY